MWWGADDCRLSGSFRSWFYKRFRSFGDCMTSIFSAIFIIGFFACLVGIVGSMVVLVVSLLCAC